MVPEHKKRVYVEDTKTQHTTHWDMDYLKQADIEALYRKNRAKTVNENRKAGTTFRKSLPALLMVVAAAGLMGKFIYLVLR